MMAEAATLSCACPWGLQPGTPGAGNPHARCDEGRDRAAFGGVPPTLLLKKTVSLRVAWLSSRHIEVVGKDVGVREAIEPAV